MSVVANRSGNTATVTITIDVTDIIASSGLSNAEKRLAGLRRAVGELTNGIQALVLSDTQLDQQVTDLTASVASVKSARPTGTL